MARTDDAKVRIIFGFPNFSPRKIAQEQFLGGISTGATGRRPSVGATEERETRDKFLETGGRVVTSSVYPSRPAAASP